MKLQKEHLRGSILYSLQNEASLNIIEHLKKDWKWKEVQKGILGFSACGKPDCCTGFSAVGEDKSILEIVPNKQNKADYYLYASSHKSEKKMPALTAHIPGNWGANEMGGDRNTLNIAYACKLKQILKMLEGKAKKEGLDWAINAEVDHHGPTPDNGEQALIFVEIGSSKKEWENPLAGKIVAGAMFSSLLVAAKKYDTYIAFGGGHYTPLWTDFLLGKRLIDGKEIAISHMCPKYRADELDEQIILQAAKKSFEKIEGALIDYKGLNSQQRNKIIEILEKNKIKWIRV